MAGNAYLGCDGDVVPHMRAAGNSGQCDNDAMLAHHDVVSDLDEIVYFSPFPDDGAAEPGAVNRCVGSYVHIVLQFHNAYLVDAHIAAIISHQEAEAVGTDDGARLDGDATAELAAFADGDIGVQAAVFPHRDAVTDLTSVAYVRAVADFAVCADAGVSPHADLVRIDFR